MSAIVSVHGVVRQVERKFSRKTGSDFGTEFAVLTDAGGILGETLKVLMFDAREGEPALPAPVVGDTVDWIVEVDASPYGLNATYRGEVGLTPDSLPYSFPADADADALAGSKK